MPPNPFRWPAEYQAVACSEGWGLFTTDGAATETYRNHVLLINRDDEAERFESDEAALQHVVERAKKGSAVHRRALELHMTLREAS